MEMQFLRPAVGHASPARHRACRRLACACALSLAGHVWLLHARFVPDAISLTSDYGRRLDVVIMPPPDARSRLDAVRVPLQPPALPEKASLSQDDAAAVAAVPVAPAGIVDAVESGETHYSAAQLDGLPRLLTPLAGVHQALPDGGARGEALVTVWIGWSGQVHRVEVREADDEAAGRLIRAALLAAQFEPATRAGRAVNSRVTLRIKTAAQ